MSDIGGGSMNMEEANIWALVNQMREENQMQAEKGTAGRCGGLWKAVSGAKTCFCMQRS